MEYKVVANRDPVAFEKEVEYYLEHGWRLAGNLVVEVSGNGNRTLYQAMTRGDVKSPESFG